MQEGNQLKTGFSSTEPPAWVYGGSKAVGSSGDAAEESESAVAPGAGLTFSNNLWTTAPPAAAAAPSNVAGDPLVTRTGTTTAGTLTAQYFTLNGSSPAINAGYDTGISLDFFLNPRVGMYDIGAVEYQR